MELMETTTPTQNLSIQAGATPAVPSADRVRIVSTPGIRGGKPRIDGHRITVADVAVWYERMSMNPNEIVSNYPTITLSDVHAALAYYYEHRERIDADIHEGEEAVDKLRAGQPSIFEKVRQRIAADAKDDTLPPG
jgi:uncharacterized protein (DUF433 family)